MLLGTQPSNAQGHAEEQGRLTAIPPPPRGPRPPRPQATPCNAPDSSGWRHAAPAAPRPPARRWPARTRRRGSTRRPAGCRRRPGPPARPPRRSSRSGSCTDGRGGKKGRPGAYRFSWAWRVSHGGLQQRTRQAQRQWHTGDVVGGAKASLQAHLVAQLQCSVQHRQLQQLLGQVLMAGWGGVG